MISLHPALQTYVDKWLNARPARSLTLQFIEPDRREVLLALAALEQELLSAAYGISEPTVAMTKLNWWGEELSGAAMSGGRHPLTQALFGDEQVRALDPQLWLRPVMTALEQLDAATASDFTTQLTGAEVFHGTLAKLETRVWFGADADPTRATRFASLDHLLRALSVLESGVNAERLPLPMSRLARHHLEREALAQDSPERRAAVRAQLADLLQPWRDAWDMPGPLSLFRGLDARLGGHWVHRARHAADPLLRLKHLQRHQTNLAALTRAWAAARSARASKDRIPSAPGEAVH